MMYLSPSKIVFFLASSTDTDEMLHFAAFHPGVDVYQSTPLGVSSISQYTKVNVKTTWGQCMECRKSAEFIAIKEQQEFLLHTSIDTVDSSV